MRLRDKVAVITGATSGMGRAAAVLFAREGAKVVISGRRQELGEEVARGIRAEGGDVVFVQGDVSVAADVQRIIKAAVDTYGRLDVLFNNAGTNGHENGRPDQEPEEVWDHIIDVNLKGTFLGIKYAVPEMRKVGGGSIINNSSVNDTQADDVSTSSYHASKGGVTALTKEAAVVYAADSIRVNCVNPGAVATEMSGVAWDELDDSEVIEAKKKRQPLPRMGHPMDVAYAALYFASDEAAFVTGATLLIDGGQSSLYR